MNLFELNIGDGIRTADDNITAEIIGETEDGESIKVRYVNCSEQCRAWRDGRPSFRG